MVCSGRFFWVDIVFSRDLYVCISETLVVGTWGQVWRVQHG